MSPRPESVRLHVAPMSGTLVSALLAAAAFPPLEMHHLIWIALAPWLYSVGRCDSLREASIQGLWLNGLAGSIATFWIVPAVPHYLDVAPIVGVLVHALHASISQLQFVAFAPVFLWMLRRTSGGQGALVLPLLSASVYVGLDWAIPSVFQDTIGIPLHAYPSLSQVVDLGGLWPLSFLVVAVNVGVLEALRTGRDRDLDRMMRVRRSLGPLGPVVILVAFAVIYGVQREREWTKRLDSPDRTFRVGLVQGSVSGELKHRWARGDAAAAREALEVYLGATESLLRARDAPMLVVWPETTFPGIFRRPENEDQLRLNLDFDRYIARRGLPFVFGAYDLDEHRDRRTLRNSIFVVEPGPDQPAQALSPMQVYHKSILLPLGERLPGIAEERIRRWLPGAGQFSPGTGPALLEVETPDGGAVRLGPSICYEDLFPSHLHALVKLGADVILNVSNDAWFGDLGEPRLHLIFAKLASLTTRLPQVRAANTGYSALILPNGEIPVVSRYGRTEALDLVVPIVRAEPTLASRWGSWFGWSSGLVAIPGLLWLRRRPNGAD